MTVQPRICPYNLGHQLDSYFEVWGIDSQVNPHCLHNFTVISEGRPLNLGGESSPLTFREWHHRTAYFFLPKRVFFSKKKEHFLWAKNRCAHLPPEFRRIFPIGQLKFLSQDDSIEKWLISLEPGASHHETPKKRSVFLL